MLFNCNMRNHFTNIIIVEILIIFLSHVANHSFIRGSHDLVCGFSRCKVTSQNSAVDITRHILYLSILKWRFCIGGILLF
jgi:hypothetical protein